MILPHEAEAVQKVVAEAFGDPAGVRDPAALREALARPFATQNGIPVYPTHFAKVSALFQSLLEKRPFAGANRRTAAGDRRPLAGAEGLPAQGHGRAAEAALGRDGTGLYHVAPGVRLDQGPHGEGDAAPGRE